MPLGDLAADRQAHAGAAGLLAVARQEYLSGLLEAGTSVRHGEHHAFVVGGILTGTILGLARALGEAAPLILIGAKSSGFSGGDWGDLTGDFTALPMIISDWTTRPAALWNGPTQAAILVTLVIVLGINTIGIVVRNRFDKKKS